MKRTCVWLDVAALALLGQVQELERAEQSAIIRAAVTDYCIRRIAEHGKAGARPAPEKP